MVNWMWDAKRKAASVDNKKTERIDLPENGFLSSIMFRFSPENGATSNINNHVHDCVTKLEAVGAGGQTMKSITGVECQGLDWFDHQRRPWGQYTEAGGATNQEQFILNFGRFFGDTEYMLDCSKIVDGQLKLTWDLAEVRATGATAFLGTTQEIDVIYLIPHDWTGPAPKGYIKSTETKSFTSAASGIDYVKIPRDNPIRRIMIRAYESGISPAATLTNLKLNADNGKLVPWDNSMTKLKDLNSIYYKPVWMYFNDVYADNADTREVHVAYSHNTIVEAVDRNDIVRDSDEVYGKVTIAGTQHDNSAIGGDVKLQISTHGWGYHNCFMLPFDKPVWDPQLFLQAQTFGELNLELTQGNAGGAVAVVTEEVVAQ